MAETTVQDAPVAGKPRANVLSGVARAALGVLLVLPGALVVFLAFRAGGFFPSSPALVALALLGVLVVRLAYARAPLAGVSPALAVAVAAMAAFALWTFLSGRWGTQARALLEFDRALAYGVALGLFGTIPFTPARLAWAVRLLALGILVVATTALATRLLPDVFPTPPEEAVGRLSYPLTYWNALGLLCALGTLLALHLTTSAREPRAIRVLAAAAAPVLTVTLLLTFSRGAMASLALGVVVLLVVGRPLALPGGALAVLPACTAALLAAYGADALASDLARTSQGVAEGRDVARVTLLACAGAALLRGLALPLDAWMQRLAARRRPWPARRTVGLWAATGAACAVAAVALGAPGAVERQYDRFVEGDETLYEDRRDRLADAGNNGRLALWEVALDGFRTEPVRGVGAGTFQTLWLRERGETTFVAIDGHSLYLEVMGELGLVGLGLLVVVLVAILGAFAVRARGPGRGPPAALLAAGVAWAVHAGADWHWEMPAVTLWLFALGGLALAAAPREGAPRRATGLPLRAGLVLLALALALVPLGVARSQAHLDAAGDAFVRNDCAGTVEASLASVDVLAIRPEPFELMGYCDVRLGYEDLAVRNLERAVARDPESWEVAYGLALVRGAAGRDPRGAIRRALELNPGEEIVKRARRRLRGRDPRDWRREARALPLPGYFR